VIEVLVESQIAIDKVHGFAGRSTCSKVIFSSDTELEPYAKIDFESEEYKYFGVLIHPPIGDVYAGLPDYIVKKDL
jgi:hypothetical protein